MLIRYTTRSKKKENQNKNDPMEWRCREFLFSNSFCVFYFVAVAQNQPPGGIFGWKIAESTQKAPESLKIPPESLEQKKTNLDEKRIWKNNLGTYLRDAQLS